MNSLIVHLVQIFMIKCVLDYASNNKGFTISPPKDKLILIARFVASMFMHIAVEKDVRNGLNMMKYSVNHYDHFLNPFASFLFGFLFFIISYFVEINVMIVLTSMPDVMGVVMKYVSLAAISKIPMFYFASLRDHKMLMCKDLQLKVLNIRRNNPLRDAPTYVHAMRFFYKTCRTLFCAFGFYFTPFTAIFINM